MRTPSILEREFLFRIKTAGLPMPEQEYKFHTTRKWRFDFAFLQKHKKIAVELEGGIFSGGRHTRGSGFIADCQKYNAAALLGWTVLRYPKCLIREAIDDIRFLLKERDDHYPYRQRSMYVLRTPLEI